MSGQTRISSPGRYQGDAERLYDGWELTSRYVPVRDGTRLAVDIYQPAQDGEPASEPYPVLLATTPYRRASCDAEGQITRLAETYAGGIVELTRYGYVVVVADLRGRGASFGISRARQDWQETWDIHDLIEWCAAQPWCDGKVGMWGCSYLGAMQIRVAATQPPHLRACFAASGATGDLYEKQVRGGILDPAALAFDPSANDALTLPVDDDPDGLLLREALSSRPYNGSARDLWLSLPYRDSFSPLVSSRFFLENGPLYYRERIQASGVAICHWLTWDDTTGARLKLVDFANFGSPSKLLIGGAWGHCGGMSRNVVPERFDPLAEHHRFFDAYLKDIDNGLRDEPPVYFVTSGAVDGDSWRFAPAWPLPEEQRATLYLHGEPAGSAPSVNDGSLATAPPAEDDEPDEYTVIHDLTTATMAADALTFTSAPLTEDVELTGHPVVHLWLSSTAADVDVHALLEDIDGEGQSVFGPWAHLDGRLRASHRARHTPPFDNLGLPWHRSYEEDVKPLPPDEPVELVFDLAPLSRLFRAGHRIRLTIAGSPFDGSGTPSPAGESLSFTLHHTAAHPSRLELPVIARP